LPSYDAHCPLLTLKSLLGYAVSSYDADRPLMTLKYTRDFCTPIANRIQSLLSFPQSCFVNLRLRDLQHSRLRGNTLPHSAMVTRSIPCAASSNSFSLLSSDDTPGVSPLGFLPWWLSRLACWCYSVVRILPSFSHHTCHIQYILLSYLVSDTRDPPFLVYRSSNQPDVAGM
jgi:hypothetical protein